MRKERTPTDFALEFAEYMAKGAEQLIEAMNALAMAEEQREGGDGDDLDNKVYQERQDFTEALTGLRNDIHQFRTRRDRAKAVKEQEAQSLAEARQRVAASGSPELRDLRATFGGWSTPEVSGCMKAINPAPNAEPAPPLFPTPTYRLSAAELAGARAALRRSVRIIDPAPAALPKEPPPGLLMSMALRYDHGLGCPGYYDQELLCGKPGAHAKKLEATLRIMRQLYEEVAGHGFYKPDREAEYTAMAAASGAPAAT